MLCRTSCSLDLNVVLSAVVSGVPSFQPQGSRGYRGQLAPKKYSRILTRRMKRSWCVFLCVVARTRYLVVFHWVPQLERGVVRAENTSLN